MSKLYDIAQLNPSLAGRAKLIEILENEDRSQREAFIPNEGVSQNEHASILNSQSPTLRALYEDGAVAMGNTVVIPTDQPRSGDSQKARISELSHIMNQIGDREQAQRFYDAANAIAGTLATEHGKIETFKYYLDAINKDEYGKVRASEEKAIAVTEVVSQMETMASEMKAVDEAYIKGDPLMAERLDTPNTPDEPVIYDNGLDEPIELDEISTHLDDYAHLGSSSKAIHVTENNFLRIPEDAPLNARERYIERVLPAIDQQLESGVSPKEIRQIIAERTNELNRAKFEERVSGLLEGATRYPAATETKVNALKTGNPTDFPESKVYAGYNNNRVPVQSLGEFRDIQRMARTEQIQVQAYLGKTGQAIPFKNEGIEQNAAFLKSYITERMRDPTTRALNESPQFREAYSKLNEAKTPAEVNQISSGILAANRQAHTRLREHLDNPGSEKPQVRSFSFSERNELFRHYMPDHYTAEMRELRQAWGALPAEREKMKQDLASGKLEKSPSLQTLEKELGGRTSVKAVNHLWAAMKGGNENAKHLAEAYAKLGPHERDYFYEAKQAKVTGMVAKLDLAPEKQVASVDPTKSASYREYIRAVDTINKEQLSTSDKLDSTKSLQSARVKAWGTISENVVDSPKPTEAETRLSALIAHSQEKLQFEARAAKDMRDGFINTKLAEHEPALRAERNAETYERAFLREVGNNPSVATRFQELPKGTLTQNIGETLNWERLKEPVTQGVNVSRQEERIATAERKGDPLANELREEMPKIQESESRYEQAALNAHSTAYREMEEVRQTPLYSNPQEKEEVVAKMVTHLSETDKNTLTALNQYAETTKDRFLDSFPEIDKQREMVRSERKFEAPVDLATKTDTIADNSDGRWWHNQSAPAVPVTNVPSQTEFER